MSTLHVRLRDERMRIGLHQYSLAAVGGVKPNAQVKYENGRRLPRGDYLAAIAATGIDLLFILTGKRSVGLSQLSSHERVFITAYRDIARDDQGVVSDLIFRVNGDLNKHREARNVAHYDGADGTGMFNG